MQQEYYTTWSTIILNFFRSSAANENGVVRLMSMLYYTRGTDIHITDGNNFVAKTSCEELETIALSWPSLPSGTTTSGGRKLFKWMTEAHTEVQTNPIYPPNFIINVLCHTIYNRRYQSQINRIEDFEDPIISGFISQDDIDNPLKNFDKIPYRRFKYKDTEFPTCAETSLFNLMNFFQCFGIEPVSPTTTTEFYAWLQERPEFIYKHILPETNTGYEVRALKENLTAFLSLYEDKLDSFIFDRVPGGTKIYHKLYPDHFGTYTHSGSHSEFTVNVQKIKFMAKDGDHKYAESIKFYIFNLEAMKFQKHRWVLTGNE